MQLKVFSEQQLEDGEDIKKEEEENKEKKEEEKEKKEEEKEEDEEEKGTQDSNIAEKEKEEELLLADNDNRYPQIIDHIVYYLKKNILWRMKPLLEVRKEWKQGEKAEAGGVDPAPCSKVIYLFLAGGPLIKTSLWSTAILQCLTS